MTIINKELINQEYNKILKDNINNILADLEIIISDESDFEGNCFYLNKTFIKKDELINKQKNLFWIGFKNPINICEIGFNAGHSSLLLLIKNNSKNINFTIFDISYHSYTKQCYEYICNKFPDVNFDFIEGDSVTSIPNWINNTKKYEYFDVVHVDGGHALEILTNDFANSLKILKKDGLIIVDDVQKEHINNIVNVYLSTGSLKEVTHMFETSIYPHRILQKII